MHKVFKDVIKTKNGQRTGGLTGKLKMETRRQPRPITHYLSGPLQSNSQVLRRKYCD